MLNRGGLAAHEPESRQPPPAHSLLHRVGVPEMQPFVSYERWFDSSATRAPARYREESDEPLDAAGAIFLGGGPGKCGAMEWLRRDLSRRRRRRIRWREELEEVEEEQQQQE